MTGTSDDPRGAGLSLEEARHVAQRFLDDLDWAVELVAGRHRETPEAWIFLSEARDGEPFFGNPVLVVHRFTGEVDTPYDGWKLLSPPELTWIQRIRRWWSGEG